MSGEKKVVTHHFIVQGYALRVNPHKLLHVSAPLMWAVGIFSMQGSFRAKIFGSALVLGAAAIDVCAIYRDE